VRDDRKEAAVKAKRSRFDVREDVGGKLRVHGHDCHNRDDQSRSWPVTGTLTAGPLSHGIRDFAQSRNSVHGPKKKAEKFFGARIRVAFSLRCASSAIQMLSLVR
jgi:hypothetical protein